MDKEASANTTLNARLFLRAMFREETISPNPRIMVRKLEMCRNSRGNRLCRTRILSGSLGPATDQRLMMPLPEVMTVTEKTRKFWIDVVERRDLRVFC